MEIAFKVNIIKDKIINIVGPSGSGKTSLAIELENHGYNIIHSFTTRPPRGEDEWGHTFVEDLSEDFTTSDNNIIPNENVIAYKEVYEGVHYWATMEQIKDKGISIYVIDPEGANQIVNRLKSLEVVTIFLSVDMEERIYRMQSQDRSKQEIYNRMIDDKKLFRICKCDYVLDANRDTSEVLEDILELIEKN